MKSLTDDRRNQLSKVYTMSLRANIQEFCEQCTKASSVDRSFAQLQTESSSESFSFDLRKEIALRELICAVSDLDEKFPPNFMKAHFNVL